MSKGIDVSHYQGEVDYAKVAADGYEFVVAKATEGSKNGSNIVDPFFVRNIEEANKNGLQTHAYHYFLGISENDARAEADLFIENLKKVNLKGRVFVDVEDKSLTNDPEGLTRYVNAFLEHLEMNGYTKLGIYSNLYFYQKRLVASQLKPGIFKWIGAYNDKGAGIDCDIWQHASDGQVSGVSGNVDLNIAYNPEICKPIVEVHDTYSIQSGDTFWGIEDKHGWTHGILQSLNPSVDARHLSVGQKVNVPGSISQPVYHTVQKDENLTVIASNNGISLAQIEQLNPQIKHPDVIQTGDKVRVK